MTDPRQPKPPRRTDKLRDRTKTQRNKADRLLWGRTKGGPRPRYDSEVHPAGILAYFQEALDTILDIERIETEKGQVTYLQKPVDPPLMAGYANIIKVSQSTLSDWAQKYEEFGEAVQLAKGIQEQVYLKMGTFGAYPERITMFMLKNHHDWTDKVEQKNTGAVTLVFDSQDEEAG